MTITTVQVYQYSPLYTLNLSIFNELTPLIFSGWSINALMWLLTPPKITTTPTSSEDSREIYVYVYATVVLY